MKKSQHLYIIKKRYNIITKKMTTLTIKDDVYSKLYVIKTKAILKSGGKPLEWNKLLDMMIETVNSNEDKFYNEVEKYGQKGKN